MVQYHHLVHKEMQKGGHISGDISTSDAHKMENNMFNWFNETSQAEDLCLDSLITYTVYTYLWYKQKD